MRACLVVKNMISPKAIHWFRQDLRLHDNPALTAATHMGCVVPIYILDDLHAGNHSMGSASRVWLHHALCALHTDLKNTLSVFQGDPLRVLTDLCMKHDIQHIFWNRCYEPWRIKRDAHIKKTLAEKGIQVKSFNGSLLWEPWTVKKDDGTPYKVFTPFYRKGCLQTSAPRQPLQAVLAEKIVALPQKNFSVATLQLLPKSNWAKHITSTWDISEAGARKTLRIFLEKGLPHYKIGRNFPAKPYVSSLSPYLHWGQVSPHDVWHAAISKGENQNTLHFCSELGWREFSYYLLYHNPALPTHNLQKKFDAFPWAHNVTALQAWQKGQTGIPMVDAGMRQLWQTGTMHNRVRMITASFLVKNLRIHWHEGFAWFWDCLFDADLANNSASWQWVAGCGADAAPYFRIFNPVSQAEKFDPEGVYIKNFVPELKHLPLKYVFAPWLAPVDVLENACVKLGTTYPKPLVDLALSRAQALKAFETLKT